MRTKIWTLVSETNSGTSTKVYPNQDELFDELKKIILESYGDDVADHPETGKPFCHGGVPEKDAEVIR